MKKLSLTLYSIIIIFFLNNDIFAKEEQISGKANIIDGDTIRINSKKIRLFGIDAPEKKQTCKKPFINFNFLSFQKNYNCGRIASLSLKKKIGNMPIKCISKSRDRYKRYLGVCFLDDLDLNKWMVKNGHAIAYKKYSRKYELQEQYAKENKLGIWQGSFIEPKEWRRIQN